MNRQASAFIFLLLFLASCSDKNGALAECAEEPVESESGLLYEDLVCGSGEEAIRGASLTIAYTAELADGERYASSDEQGGELVFPLGRGQVINGLDEGVRSMRVGGTRLLTIPPELAYGEAGFPPHVRPGESVVYEVTLLEVTDNN